MPKPPGTSQHSLGDPQLAAILFTDVVGFSGLVEKNEMRTLGLVQRDLKFIANVCSEYGGDVLKNTGDGCLATFRSVESAVRTALRIQAAVAEAAQKLPPEKILHHRIGIHLGDVFFGKGDVLGNGVNIAARLLGEAEPDGICISQPVYDLVKNRLGIKAVFIGARELKNIREAVPVYRLLLGAAAQEATGTEPKTTAKNGNRKIMIGAVAAILAAATAGSWLLFHNKSPQVAASSVPIVAAAPTTIPVTQPLHLTSFIDDIIRGDPTYQANTKIGWRAFPLFNNDNVTCKVDNGVYSVTTVADGFHIGIPAAPWGNFDDVTIEATSHVIGAANATWGLSLIGIEGTSRRVVRVVINDKGVARIDLARMSGLDDTGRIARPGDIHPFANQFIHSGDVNNTILINVNNHKMTVRVNGETLGDSVDITPLGRTTLHMTVEGTKGSRAEFQSLRMWIPKTASAAAK